MNNIIKYISIIFFIAAGDISAMHPKLRFETQGSRKKLPRKVRFALPEDSDSVVELPSNSNYNPGFDYSEASGERMEFGGLDLASIGLFDAVSKRNVYTAKQCCDLGAKIDSCLPDGRTPLHVAAAAGDLRMVQFLIANKATIDVVTPAGKTAEKLAQQKKHKEVVKYLKNGALKNQLPQNASAASSVLDQEEDVQPNRTTKARNTKRSREQQSPSAQESHNEVVQSKVGSRSKKKVFVDAQQGKALPSIPQVILVNQVRVESPDEASFAVPAPVQEEDVARKRSASARTSKRIREKESKSAQPDQQDDGSKAGSRQKKKVHFEDQHKQNSITVSKNASHQKTVSKPGEGDRTQNRNEAIVSSHLEIDKELAARGADINTIPASDDTSTLLHKAVESAQFEMVKDLIEKGANPLFSADISTQETCYDLALRLAQEVSKGPEGHKRKKIAQYLDSLGANPFLKELKCIINRLSSTDSKDGEQRIKDDIRLFLDKYKHKINKESINTPDPEYGITVLNEVALCSGSKDQLQIIEIMKMLVEVGATVDVPTQFGHTALYFAALNWNEEVFQYLLEQGADPLRIVKCMYVMGNGVTIKMLVEDRMQKYRVINPECSSRFKAMADSIDAALAKKQAPKRKSQKK